MCNVLLARQMDRIEPPRTPRIQKGGRMTKYKKKDFPVDRVRRFLEPGPVVLVSSAYKDQRDIMTMGWHMILNDEPSLVGCFIWDQNYSHELVRQSKQCVINVPEVVI